jgi:hypothetical protein
LTICIGAICDEGKSVILSADRMITVDMLSQEYEHGIPKCSEVSETCLALTAGSALLPMEVFYGIEEEINRLRNPIVRDVVETIKKRYVGARRKLVEELYLIPRGFSFETFYQNIEKLPPAISASLDNKIEMGGSNGDHFSLQLVVGGVDGLGGHIYIIDDPGSAACFDDIGYACIGSGEPHAWGSFIANDYTSKVLLNEALYITYEAKVRAQKAPGVGNVTDMWVITNKGISKVSDETLMDLQRIYELKASLERTRTAEMNERISKLKVGR